MAMIWGARIQMHSVLTREPTIAPNISWPSLFFPVVSGEALLFPLQANFCYSSYSFARSLLSSNCPCSPSSLFFDSSQYPNLFKTFLHKKKKKAFNLLSPTRADSFPSSSLTLPSLTFQCQNSWQNSVYSLFWNCSVRSLMITLLPDAMDTSVFI